MIGQSLDDDLDHEEFYPEADSILEAMQDLFSLIYIDEDEDDE